MKKTKVFVCNFCGSKHVSLDAQAFWNKEKQQWVFEIYDQTKGYCRDCDGLTEVSEEYE